MKKTVSIFLLLNLGCSEKTMVVNEGMLEIKESLSFIGENDFVHQVRDIFIEDDDFFLINSGAVYKTNEHFHSFERIGETGNGPFQLVEPQSLFVQKGNVYVTDVNTLKINKYNLFGKPTGEWRLPDRYFSLNPFISKGEDSIYFSSPNQSQINGFALDNFSEAIASFGEHVDFKDKDEEFANGFYHLLLGNKEIISVSKSMNTVQTYSFDGVNKDRIELPIEFFANRLRYKEQEIRNNPEKIRSTFNLIADAYFSDGRIYLLLNENKKEDLEYFSNQVLVLNVDEESKLSLVKSFRLDGDLYQQIAVKDNLLYAYNHLGGAIEKYEIEL